MLSTCFPELGWGGERGLPLQLAPWAPRSRVPLASPPTAQHMGAAAPWCGSAPGCTCMVGSSVRMGLWSCPQGGGTKQGLRWAEGLPHRGPRRTAPGCTTCGMHWGLGWAAQSCSAANPHQPWPEGAAVPGPPQGRRGAAGRTNNSWRTNNLTCWSAGGELSWGASPAVPALPCLQGQPAVSQGRGSSSEAAPVRQRCGVALVAEPPRPQRQPRGPPNPPGPGSSPAHWQP